MNKQKHNLYLKAPEGVRVQRHNLEDGEVRFTIRDKGFKRLVAVAKNGQFTWLKNGFSA